MFQVDLAHLHVMKYHLREGRGCTGYAKLESYGASFKYVGKLFCENNQRKFANQGNHDSVRTESVYIHGDIASLLVGLKLLSSEKPP